MVLSSPRSATSSISWKALQIGAVLIAAFWIRQGSSQTPSADVAAWGESSNGLRIGISSNSVTMSPTAAKFAVAIQNTGDADRVVNLGIMLANGRKMYAMAVGLILTSPNGVRRELNLRGPAIIAGRLDDLIVALPAGAIYGLAVSLADYDSPGAPDFQGGLVPGRYQIAVRFDGRAATDHNLDSPGIPLMNVWKGRIESRTLTFEIRRQ